MPTTTAVRRAVALSAATAAMAVAATVGPPAAVASPDSTVDAAFACAVGMVPLVNQNTWLRAEPGFTYPLYTVAEGRAVRLTAGPAVADGLVWWLAHGNDTGNGWVPEQNLTCA